MGSLVRRFLLVVAGIALVACLWLLQPLHILAATITVNDPGDTTIGGDHKCTLREALANVNAASDTTSGDCVAGSGAGDTILFASSVGTITTGSKLTITKPVTITGNGATTIIQANATAFDVFEVKVPSGTVAFSALTIRNGSDGIANVPTTASTVTITVTNAMIAGNNTSGIVNAPTDPGAGTVTVTNTIITGNGSGILIAPTGSSPNPPPSPLTVTNSTISGNTSNGIENLSSSTISPLTVTGTTISGNTNQGIINAPTNGQSPLTVTNTTISGNGSGNISDSGILNTPTDGQSPLTVTNTTIANNAGNGINNVPTGAQNLLTVTNTIVTASTAQNCTGSAITDGGHNLEFGGTPSNTCGFTTGAPQFDLLANPLLGTLGNYGGTTQTVPLLPGSPAIDHGDDTICANTAGIAPVAGVDQRGITRPQGAHCDIGAFEYVFPIPTVALAASPNPSAFGQSVIFTAIVTGGSGTPSGSVTFKDGATTLGFAPLSGGVASFTTAGLTAGNHTITAVYGGDATFGPSTSSPLTQVVGPGALTSIAVTAATATIPVGGTDQFTATCTFASGPANCTTAVTWASDTPTVATITAAGLATGVSAGSAKITATLSGITSNAVTLTVTGGGPPPAGGLQFYPLAKPVRLLDTRAGSTAFVHPNASLSAGQTLSLPGQFSYQGVTIPATAQAIVGNATVANGSNGTPPGFATIFPSGVPLPLTSNLNFVPGTVRPNAFTVALGSDTKFNLYSSSGGDFVVDISGYYAPVGAGGLYFHPLSAPVRELDTRAGATAFVHPNAALTAGQTLTLPGSFTYNSIAIPASAKALVGNATVANGSNGTPAGFATLFPDDVPLPLASNLNFVPGTVAPNAFTVALGAGGGYKLYSSTGGDFVVDITGYLDTSAVGGLLFTPLSAPVRELDTRAGATAFVHPNATLTAGQTLTLPGSFTYTGITVPVAAQALVGNATVANDGNTTPAGFATLYPDGVPLPLASNLNFVPQQVAPNAITVGIGADGKYDLYSSSGGDFIIDLTGYFAAAPGGAAKPTGKSG